MEEIKLEKNETVDELMIDGYKIVQNDTLYRFTSDSVLLTRFAKAKRGDVVADFCSGSGIVAFHFFALNQDKNLTFTLVEMQKSLADLSKKTIALNGFQAFEVVNKKVQELGNGYVGKFSLILCNPPYERGGAENQIYEKAVCRKEITITLGELSKAVSKALKYGGRFCMVHRADRLAEICYTLKCDGLEVKRIQFISGKEGDTPYLVLVEAVKGGKPCTKLEQTLIN